jgi:signal transduction histidine kinase/DNA-binding response OmpR family regulator
MKRNLLRAAPTVGVLTAWQVYEGTTVDGYLHVLLDGIHAAARDRACNLLLACGVAPPPPPRVMTPAWPALMPDTQFVPVGPWNADGLIAVPDTLSATRLQYIESLIAEGYPIVFAGAPELRPSVAVDNAGGIEQAIQHLIAHGHHNIAFITGHVNQPGDSVERLEAYRAALQRHNLGIDTRLIAIGDQADDIESGQQAMQRILAAGASFSALITFNDWVAIGAMEALRSAGLNTPHDVAIIGFDDRLHARVQTPPLTTVRHPTFELGYQTLIAMLDLLDGKWDGRAPIRIPTELVIRQSCGCRAGVTLIKERESSLSAIESSQSYLARKMAEAAAAEARHYRFTELYSTSERLIAILAANPTQTNGATFNEVLTDLLQQTEARDEDAYIWHAAVSALQREITEPTCTIKLPDPQTQRLLDQAHLAISEQARQQTTRALIREMEAADHLGLMTSHLLAALDAVQISRILSDSLPSIGIRHMQVCLFLPAEDDRVALSRSILHCGLNITLTDRQFITRHFPPPDFYPANEPFHLAVLPLVIQDNIVGFVALEASNLEPCAVIMRNVAAALRSSQLYHDAAEGRRLAEEANHLKTRFLSTVSHELRTPLNVIVGLSELMLREQAQGTSPNRQDLERICASAQHLGFLIRDVLDLASSDAGQLRLSFEALDLFETLQLVVSTGEQLARDKGLTWQVRVPDRAPRVWGDRTRLRQVTLNFISNAIKFTPRGTVTLSIETTIDHITVSVSDTGLGIPLQEQQSIFNEFYQSERTAARGYGGLGLGLAISKHLIELHGGEIGVRSTGAEGEGATFYFTLPLMMEQPDVSEPAERPIPSGILLLTDQLMIGERVGAYLREQGFEIVTQIVAPGQDWHTQALEVSPSAILLDRNLFEEQGWAIIRQLKEHPATREIPVVIYELPQHGQAGVVLEFDYRLKPLNEDQLTRLLAKPMGNTTPPSTILIVDDDPAILDVHTRLIYQQLPNCRVLQARHGREALSIVENTRPDLILLDLMMPELDGFGVLEALRANESTHLIPVVVLTAKALTESDMARLNQGVMTVLEKGVFSAEETLARVAAALTRTDKSGTTARRLVRKAIAYLNEHYSEPISRDQLANYVSVSENYLTHCFHQEVGISPMTYLNRYRIKQARALLETSDQNITEVALTVGFSDSTYFSRVFQREVGVSPGAYRRGRRKS